MDVERPHQEPGRVADPTVGASLYSPGYWRSIAALGELITHLRERRPVGRVPVHRLAV